MTRPEDMEMIQDDIQDFLGEFMLFADHLRDTYPNDPKVKKFLVEHYIKLHDILTHLFTLKGPFKNIPEKGTI